MAAGKITLKLLIDKDKNRVAFAESGKYFVDILLSFLTLPMGSIVRLLGKQYNLECFDKLYKSVENLGTEYLQTEACKTMLLQPISAAEDLCENLAIKVDDTKPRRDFFCTIPGYCPSFLHYPGQWVSTVQSTRCQCGQKMDEEVTTRNSSLAKNSKDLDNGVFMKGNVRFMISDDLWVMPICTDVGNFLLNKLGVNNWMVFEEKMVEFGRDEVLNLLKCSLQSNTPLTDVFLRNSNYTRVVNLGVKANIPTRIVKEVNANAKKINLKLFLSKSREKVVYGEAGEDFVDLLFSFLVLPVGSVLNKLDGHSSMGSIDNLYKSVEDLKLSEYLISEDHRSLLLSPKLGAYFGCDNQIIQTTEMSLCDIVVLQCMRCYDMLSNCSCSKKHTRRLSLRWINPKSPSPTNNSGGRYAKGPVKFMVTDEMAVTPLSFITVIDAVNELKKSFSGDIEEKEVYIGEAEVLALLRASLITNTALTSTFYPKRKKRFQHLYEEY